MISIETRVFNLIQNWNNGVIVPMNDEVDHDCFHWGHWDSVTLKSHDELLEVLKDKPWACQKFTDRVFANKYEYSDWSELRGLVEKLLTYFTPEVRNAFCPEALSDLRWLEHHIDWKPENPPPKPCKYRVSLIPVADRVDSHKWRILDLRDKPHSTYVTREEATEELLKLNQ